MARLRDSPAGIEVRGATGSDVEAIARVAVAAGQDEEWAGADPAYVRHLLSRGTVVVTPGEGTVLGFGAAMTIGDGPAAVSMLCDLFVDPRAHGRGYGRAMLNALWQDQPRRMTFSSLHAHALPLYTRAGLDAWWPLLYLTGSVAALAAPPGWTVTACGPERVASLEQRWTGTGRLADHLAWAARPAGQSVKAIRRGEPAAAGTVAGLAGEYGVVHLAVAPGIGDQGSRDAVLSVLASLRPGNGQARVCLPAPHPAVRPLLAAGWRLTGTDLFMATEPGLLDPRRSVPSPANG